MLYTVSSIFRHLSLKLRQTSFIVINIMTDHTKKICILAYIVTFSVLMLFRFEKSINLNKSKQKGVHNIWINKASHIDIPFLPTNRSEDLDISSHESEHPRQDTPNQLLACFGITFMDSTDPLKTLSNKNTANMYNLLRPYINSYLIITQHTSQSHLDIWKTYGHQNILNDTDTNDHGTPKFKSIINQIESVCPEHIPFVAYVNADILFDMSLVNTLTSLNQWILHNEKTKTQIVNKFMILGRRYNHNLDITTEIKSLTDISILPSEVFQDNAQDYFILTRNLIDWNTIPDYVIGRVAYDNALNDWAYHREILVDATNTILAIHQTTSDGNFAGHLPKIDKHYNTELPNAVYDHGSLVDSQYITTWYNSSLCSIIEKATNVVLWPEPSSITTFNFQNLKIRNSKTKQEVLFENLKEPILLVMANRAFHDVLSSFICNMQLFPQSFNHLLILLSDESMRDELETLTESSENYFATGIMYNTNVDESDLEYNTPEYINFMFQRGKLLASLIGYKDILWLEPDAVYYQELLHQNEIVSGIKDVDLLLYWDGTMYGGGFIRFSATNAAKMFYQSIVDKMTESTNTLNDQFIMKDILERSNVKYEIFDKCKYRNGLFFRKDMDADYQARCQHVQPIVQQLNWIVGKDKKIQHAKSINGWFLRENTDKLTCSARDFKVIVLTMNRHHALSRLLNSLKNVQIPEAEKDSHYSLSLDLQINVDVSVETNSIDGLILNTVQTFLWPHGIYDVVIAKQNLGIQKQWINSFPCELFNEHSYKAFLILEDDTEASPFYAHWFIQAHKTFHDPQFGAITGMRPQLVVQVDEPRNIDQIIEHIIQDKQQIRETFPIAYTLMGTWGLSPKFNVWKSFRKWFLLQSEDSSFIPVVDNIIPSVWYKQFLQQNTHQHMWEMWFIYYTYMHNLYTIYPWTDHGKTSIIRGWKERGLHYDGVSSEPDFELQNKWNNQVLNISKLIFLNTFDPSPSFI